MTSPLLTAPELAARCRVSPDALYRAARRGQIPHVRIGRLVRGDHG